MIFLLMFSNFDNNRNIIKQKEKNTFKKTSDQEYKKIHSGKK